MSVVSQHGAGENVKKPAPQDTQTRSRPLTGETGPSDSALAAARGWRLRRPAADRHAARCASRDLCSGGAPRRYPPSKVEMKKNGVGKVEVRGAAAEMTREVVFRPPGASLDALLGT